MENKSITRQVAILLYPGVTALDAVGPWEILSYLPDVETRFVGREVGPIVAESGALLMAVTHALSETPAPDIVLVPGGSATPEQMVDDEALAWLRRVSNNAMDRIRLHWRLDIGSCGAPKRRARNNPLVPNEHASHHGCAT